MGWTSNDLSLLEDAIAKAAIGGFAEVTFSDRTARRYTLGELLELRKTMKGAVSAASSSSSCTFGQFSKG